MPIIKKEWEFREGDHKHAFALYFSDSEQFYIKDFPREILDVVNSKRDAGQNFFPRNHETKQSLYDAVKRCLKEYYEIIATTKKVIVITAVFSKKYAGRNDSFGSWSSGNPNFKLPKKHGIAGEGYGFSFEWHVATEFSGAEKKYRKEFVNENGKVCKEAYPDKLGHDEIVMDYTPEREAFFRNMQAGMDKMVLAVCAFFRQDEQNLLAAIDSGMLLLPESKS